MQGGIIAFLCGPQPQAGDKPVCPLREGTVEGVIDAADVGAGAAGQGIPAGDLSDAVRSLRKGAVYANVHTTTFPGGEIRGQVNANKGKHNGNGKRGTETGAKPFFRFLLNVRGAGKSRPLGYAVPSCSSPTRSRSCRATRPGLPTPSARPSSSSA